MFPQFVISHLDILKPSIVQFSNRGDVEYSSAGVNIIIEHDKGIHGFS